MKIAVIGTGAGAVGVLTGLLEQKSSFEITLFDIGKRVFTPPQAPMDPPSEEWIRDFYDTIYRQIRATQALKFPPPKTHFAQSIARTPVNNGWRIFKSETFGGLTNYWGATMLPFTGREMAGWPFPKETLYPHYERMAEETGLAGEPDALNEYFGRDFSTRPPIRPTQVLSRLNQIINGDSPQGTVPGSYRILSGVSRFALETRKNHPQSCVYCGECLAGCFRGSIYTARTSIENFQKDPRVNRLVQGKVKKINPKTRTIHFETTQGNFEASGFEKIFLCAGTPSSSEILMRTLKIEQGPVMTDNAVYVFPILFLGKTPPKANQEPYLGLCNLLFACVPQAKGLFAEAQVYPNFDYLWRFNLSPLVWKIFRPWVHSLRSRLFWVRLYVHSDQAHAYHLQLKNGEMNFHLERKDGDKQHLRDLMASLKSAVNREGFWIPPFEPVRETTNSHYCGTFPYGGSLLNVPPNNEIWPGIYLCDSSCFPDSPAVSPTFTLMANAHRIASAPL